MGKMIAVEYEEQGRFFPQRVILRIASIAAMFYTSKEMDDPLNGRFWTLTPDGDVRPDMLLVPSAAGSVWLDGRNKPILTTMMVVGHRLGPRTLLSRCKFMSEPALHPVDHHSSFGHLSGLLPKDPAVQEHLLLCRVSHIYPGTGQSLELLMIVRELEELASSVLAVETAAAKERQNFREKRAGAPPAGDKKK